MTEILDYIYKLPPREQWEWLRTLRAIRLLPEVRA